MKTVTMLGLVCAFSLASVAAAGQAVAINSANGPVMLLSTGTLSAAEKAVLAADASWAQAYQSCDMKLMDKVVHDDILFIHGHARVDTKPVVMKETFSACRNETTIAEPIRVLVLNPDTAVVEGNLKLRNKGRTDLVQLLYTRVYVREGSDWRMIAHQTTMNPGLDAAGKPRPNPAFPGY